MGYGFTQETAYACGYNLGKIEESNHIRAEIVRLRDVDQKAVYALEAKEKPRDKEHAAHFRTRVAVYSLIIAFIDRRSE